MCLKNVIFIWPALAVWFLATAPAFAQDLIVYPAKGQSQAQMESDKSACYSWAKQQTGFDPMAAQQGVQPGGAVRGAARGALLGVTVGAIAGDAGKGAAIGAASGGLLGGMKTQSQAQQQQNAYNQNRANYNRAYVACLEAKGYTVK